MEGTATAEEAAKTPAAPTTSGAFKGFVGTTRSQEQNLNPHAYRYGYMPGVWLAKSEPLHTGYAFLPQGELIGFKSFQRGGLYDFVSGLNGTAPVPNKIGEVTAQFAAYHAQIEHQAAEGFDNGFRLFDVLTGESLAEHYFAAIHPSFAMVDHSCPRNLEVCPTCRKDVLPVSDKDVSDFILIYKQNNNLNIPLEVDTAKAIRDVIMESCSSFVRTAEDMWRELSDQKERTRNAAQPCVLQPSHYHYRNVLHILDSMEFEEQKELRLAAMIANQTSGRQANPDEVSLLREQNDLLMKRLDALEAKSKTKSKEKTEDAEVL